MCICAASHLARLSAMTVLTAASATTVPGVDHAGGFPDGTEPGMTS